jgi:hypothetical protein
MKKLIALAGFLLLTVASVLSASPLPFLAPAGLVATQNYVVLALTTAENLAGLTTYAEMNQMKLIASLFNGLDIANDVMVHPNVKNKIPMPKLSIGNGLRPYAVGMEYKAGDAVYTNRFLEVKIGKRELFLDPEAYRATYLIWLTSPGSDATRRSIPYEQFFWEEVIKNIKREINDEVAYYGFDGSATAVLDTGDPYVVGDRVKFATATNNPQNVLDWYECVTNAAAGETPDTHAAKWLNVTARAITVGFKTRIADGISASEISPVATGAITATSGVAIAAFKKLFRAYGPAYKNTGIITSCSFTDWEFLLDDLGEKYKGIKDDAEANGYLTLPESNKKNIVKPASWLGSSRRLVAGPVFMDGKNPKHMNLFMGTDLLSDLNGIDTNKIGFGLWAGIKGAMGFNYQDATGLKVGDQA